jgi:hypothetical protein
MQFCGEGEKFFLDMMRNNKYSVDQNGKLNLMVDDGTMRFKETINLIKRHQKTRLS